MEYDVLKFILEGRLSDDLILNQSSFNEIKAKFNEDEYWIWPWKHELYDGNEFTMYLHDDTIELWFRDDILFHIRIKLAFCHKREYGKDIKLFKNALFLKKKFSVLTNLLKDNKIKFKVGPKHGDLWVYLMIFKHNILIDYNKQCKGYFKIDQDFSFPTFEGNKSRFYKDS